MMKKANWKLTKSLLMKTQIFMKAKVLKRSYKKMRKVSWRKTTPMETRHLLKKMMLLMMMISQRRRKVRALSTPILTNLRIY